MPEVEPRAFQDAATPEQIERANLAVTANLDENGQPLWQSAFGYACALTAIMQSDAALQSSQPREDWQPIETAPKDGTKVDLWVVRFSSSGKHHDEHRAPEAYWDARRDRWRCKWMTANGDPAFERHYSPTHWLPLPTPPIEQENTEEDLIAEPAALRNQGDTNA